MGSHTETGSADSGPTSERVSVLDGLGFPTLVTDRDGTVTRLNDHAVDLFGVKRGDAVGETPEALVDSGSDVSAIAAEAIEQGTEITDREELFVGGGRRLHVSRTARPVFEGDECVGAVEIDRDIEARIERRERTEALETYQRRVLREFQSNLSKLAAGGLTIEPTVDPPAADFEELQTAHAEFTEMNDDRRAVVGNLAGIVEALTAQAEEVADTSGDLSAASEEVTASIQQIDASADEMARGAESLAEETAATEETVDNLSASFEEITASTQQISARSDDAADLTDEGVVSIREALDEIRAATTAASDVAAEMDDLEAHMQEVGEIVEIISDIADRTNILALNANIEAARAGSGGEGFAVVANEVKALAEQSRESADDIVGIIDETQGMTERLVASIQDANGRVESGADAVDDSADTIEDIRDHIDGTNRGIGEVADAVESQAHDAEQVSSVADETSSVAQQVSATVEEIAAGVDEQTRAMDQVAHHAQYLSEVGDDLHELVDTFRLDEDESATVDDAVAEAQVTVATETGGVPKPRRESSGDEVATDEAVTAEDGDGTRASTSGEDSDTVGVEKRDLVGNGPTQLSPEDF